LSGKEVETVDVVVVVVDVVFGTAFEVVDVDVVFGIY
jgi:hypothetical protein